MLGIIPSDEIASEEQRNVRGVGVVQNRNPLVQMEDGAAEAEGRSMIMSATMLVNTYTTNVLYVGYA